ncbi:ABC transporter substrate-binding protein [Deinococcus arenicola]|uniref:Iron-siderophore ABC transporter substrate-binding protein n=1 Tax=Deinococcus arenicola TaxID=2994950 RepID=A0ABU4DNW6_9DEIO|nr:iron-siderophore ABC transporter substrate-binding protein [Deinococcus sp. ZS9-10]MDV6373657.1 iron-siderophore ABC transporter substrate-binding protein [Deinococcus sp. ZS9-10]
MRRAAILGVALAGSLGLPASAQTVQACKGQLITHAMGQTCVSGVPKQVVALEWTYVENVLALGVQPVGVAGVAGYNEWVKVPVKLSASVQDMGSRQQPSLEKLRALQPDLIITTKFGATQNYAQFSAIAPTLVYNPYASESQYGEMRSTFTQLGAVLGRAAAARQVLSNMDAQLNRVKSDLKAAERGGESFVFAQAYTGSGGTPTMRLFTRNSMVSQILERLGLVNGWTAAPQPYGFTEVSLEGLAVLKARNFLYVTQNEDAVFAAPSIKPLWQGLPFVKANRAYALDERTWTFGGPLSAVTLANGIRAKMLGR